MRVYEFSKQFGVSTKELLETLAKGGFHISSHMSVLPEDSIDYLKKNLKLSSLAQENPTPVDVQEQPVKSLSKESVSTSPIMKESASSKTVMQEKTSSKPVVNKQFSSYKEPVAPVTKVEKPDVIIDKRVEPELTTIEKPKGAPLSLESMSVGVFAEKIKKPVADVILNLLKWGIVAAKNQILTEDVISRLAGHYEVDVIAKPKEKQEQEDKGVITTSESDRTTRLPVVVVLGHVDHGKTTLLDFIRKTRVAAREKGGITQHLGAYEASTPQGNIVFIDTPGHEAFSKMRTRGIKVADIVVLVVAADDSVMPQTIEAIKQAKAMDVPIIVAVNKIDKVDVGKIDVVKRDLAQWDLLPEDWGGQVVVVPISAKTGKGIDQLLDMIILQSQMMELQASMSGAARGYVLEAKLEKGRGVVATLLCQHGVLRVGDYFACGSTHGKVNSLVDSHGQRIQEAKPSIPVLVAGFSEMPNAGDYFEVVSQEDYKKATKTRTFEYKLSPGASFIQTKAINIIIKTDTNSSKEALLGSLAKLSKKFDKKFNIVYANIGDISESDVEFAATTGSALYALHVKAEPNAVSLAHKLGVSIHLYEIIYKFLEALEAVAEGEKEVKMIRTKIGEAVVRQVFNIKGLGVIAGCYVNDGRFSKDGTVVILRNNRKVGEGKIKSLQRDKKPVKEVHANYECGFLVDGFNEWEVDDRVECFLEVPEQSKK